MKKKTKKKTKQTLGDGCNLTFGFGKLELSARVLDIFLVNRFRVAVRVVVSRKSVALVGSFGRFIPIRLVKTVLANVTCRRCVSHDIRYHFANSTLVLLVSFAVAVTIELVVRLMS